MMLRETRAGKGATRLLGVSRGEMRHRHLSLRLHLISAEPDRKEGGIVAESPVSERQRIFYP